MHVSNYSFNSFKLYCEQKQKENLMKKKQKKEKYEILTIKKHDQHIITFWFKLKVLMWYGIKKTYKSFRISRMI